MTGWQEGIEQRDKLKMHLKNFFFFFFNINGIHLDHGNQVLFPHPLSGKLLLFKEEGMSFKITSNFDSIDRPANESQKGEERFSTCPDREHEKKQNCMKHVKRNCYPEHGKRKMLSMDDNFFFF